MDRFLEIVTPPEKSLRQLPQEVFQKTALLSQEMGAPCVLLPETSQWGWTWKVMLVTLAHIGLA